MKGYVAITDFDWYSFLQAGSPWEEVNFWQPRSHGLPRLPVGAPFFFKLKARHGSPIVGFGHFSWLSKLPAWMAWDTFGEANGAPSRGAMLDRIGALRREATVDHGGTYEIGCLLIASPTFFSEADWIRPPSDWPPNVERGKGYSLLDGEGLRLYQECLERSTRYPASIPAGSGAEIHVEPSERFGRPHLVRPRLGQRGFHVAVADVYGRACAISTEHSLPALEAAHIRPYSEAGSHDTRNGLLLRADIHRLFDQGFVTVTPDYRFLVSRRLKDDYSNGRVYYELQDRIAATGKINLPQDPAHYPDPAQLEWHVKERFVA